MGIAEQLEREGYEFQYERNEGEDRTEVWINRTKEIAVRIEWLKMEKERS